MPSKDTDARASQGASEERAGKGSALSKVPGLKAYGRLFGSSDVMQALYAQIERVAHTEATALIIGESGTGKELIARTIHEQSARANGPFVAVNCGAIPDSLIEAELFGHEKGSFTGAAQSRGGYFEHAAGGTLFLDEVTEMSPVRQVKLLRALETGKFFRVGGTDELSSDARVIAATNRDPNQAVEDNSLREDLMYRLAVFPLRAPPLRERGSDRELLAQLFLAELNIEHGTQKSFSKSALETLRAYAWPGNVREMKNSVYRAFILAETEIDLPNPHVAQRARRSQAQGDAMNIWIGTPLADAQRQVILGTLKHCEGDKRLAAKTLGVSLKTLYNRLGSYEQNEESAVSGSAEPQ